MKAEGRRQKAREGIQSGTGFVTFYKWNEKIYCLELDGTLVESSLSSRRSMFESVIKSAELDLKNKHNGKYCFSIETGWIKIPISFPELIQLPVTEMQIRLNTKMNPVLPVLVNSSYFSEINNKNSQNKGFSKTQKQAKKYVLVEFHAKPRSVKILA
jgi:hypothetical protein